MPAYLAAHQLMIAFQGVPALYFNALVGGLNDIRGVESSGRTRSINRGHWDLENLTATLDNKTSDQSIIFTELCRALELRGLQPAFAPSALQKVMSYGATHLWLKRESKEQRILVIASFSDEPTEAFLTDENASSDTSLDILTDKIVDLSQPITLAPYQVRWLSLPLINP